MLVLEYNTNIDMLSSINNVIFERSEKEGETNVEQ